MHTVSQHPILKTQKLGASQHWRNKTGESGRWWMHWPLALSVCDAFRSSYLGSTLRRLGFSEGPGKLWSRCCLKRLAPMQPPWSQPIWHCGSQLIKFGSCRSVQGVQAFPFMEGQESFLGFLIDQWYKLCVQVQCQGRFCFFSQAWQNSRGTECYRHLSGSVGQGDKSSRVMLHLFQLCLSLTAFKSIILGVNIPEYIAGVHY